MEAESPAEMKSFGALAGALRLAGSMPLPYPWRGDIAVIVAYAGWALEPFDFDEVRLLQPTRTFSGELELDVGGREVRLIEVGPAHTPGDLIVWVLDARIAIAADILFVGVTPIVWAGRGGAKPPGPRELIAAFFPMALLARDLEGQDSHQ